MRPLRVAEVAHRASLSPSAVRYYERCGLLPRPARSRCGHRLFDEEAVDRIRFIRRARALGLSLKEIRDILRLQANDHARREQLLDLAGSRLRAIDDRIEELQRLRGELVDLLTEGRSHVTEESRLPPHAGRVSESRRMRSSTETGPSRV